MTRRRTIEERVKVYGELCDILGAMKNIALMEMRKLAGAADAQPALRETLERAAADFFALPEAPRVTRTSEPTVMIGVGSERGFCGNFNVTVARSLEEKLAAHRQRPKLVLIGQRLAEHVPALSGDALVIEGPTMMEEVQSTLKRLLDAVAAQHGLREAFTLEGLAIVHHGAGGESNGPQLYRPVERFLARRSATNAPAALLLPPREFLAGLIEHYMTAMLNGVLYASLAVENRLRYAHMESAVHRLNERIAGMRSRINMIRQEEITEDIEEIILGAGASVRLPE